MAGPWSARGQQVHKALQSAPRRADKPHASRPAVRCGIHRHRGLHAVGHHHLGSVAVHGPHDGRHLCLACGHRHAPRKAQRRVYGRSSAAHLACLVDHHHGAVLCQEPCRVSQHGGLPGADRPKHHEGALRVREEVSHQAARAKNGAAHPYHNPADFATRWCTHIADPVQRISDHASGAVADDADDRFHMRRKNNDARIIMQERVRCTSETLGSGTHLNHNGPQQLASALEALDDRLRDEARWDQREDTFEILLNIQDRKLAHLWDQKLPCFCTVRVLPHWQLGHALLQ
mmetsp:Transcript_41899/g.112513  ORF Transcript_41899/g.112513 Transcript_41899/m.112513 type:complete len:289 (+) Transcript_41899:300-1166(+)